jgi:hypothetical protein
VTIPAATTADTRLMRMADILLSGVPHGGERFAPI